MGVAPAPHPKPMTERRHVNGILFVYHRPLSRYFADASNVNENIAAFGRHSKFEVWELNVDTGMPPRLPGLEFDAIFLHYSVFATGEHPYPFSEAFLDYLRDAGGYLIANFQDEHQYCGQRLAFLERVGVDCVYTLLEPEIAPKVYGNLPSKPRLVSHSPGYVGPELLDDAARFAKPEAERAVVIGYRSRPMRPYFGRGGMEKSEIGRRFAERAAGLDLAIDISVEEEERLYGDEWPRFIADCRAVLGTESGASCVDLRDEVRAAYERLGAELGREPTLEELEAEGSLARWDWEIPYRTISPRHFEAAALGVCQILYEGRYSGRMEPMRHYIPLRKDLANFDEAIERFRDADLRRELTENARRDLIDSGENGYERFIEEFDQVLIDADLSPAPPPSSELAPVARELQAPWRRRALRRLYSDLAHHPVFGRALWRISRPVLGAYRALRRLVLGRRSGVNVP